MRQTVIQLDIGLSQRQRKENYPNQVKKFILGKKLNMTQLFTENGNSVAVTVVLALPGVVTQVKTDATDKYNAVQVGYGTRRAKNVAKPQQGHLKAVSKDNGL